MIEALTTELAVVLISVAIGYLLGVIHDIYRHYLSTRTSVPTV